MQDTNQERHERDSAQQTVDASAQYQRPKKQRFAKLHEMVVRGAAIQVNPKKESLGELAKDSFKVNPLYLPRVKFWNAPDVRVTYRSACRIMLRMWSDSTPKYLTFSDVCKKNNINEFHLIKIEKKLKITALIAFSFIPIALFAIVYLWTFGFLLAGLGSAIIALSLFWKYSFLLWQTRLRSLDREAASVKRFMEQEWYLEAFK